ncbi:hypothetical protein [Streptomyces sp. ALB3]|uniref:hypothetical protein n=1 Tax=Streptomyces sp. ALB3 TaxID=3374278 RepID=UPI0037AD7CC6
MRGGEANKARPSVIVSNDGANAVADRTGRGVVTVVPPTSHTSRVHPFQVSGSSGASAPCRQRMGEIDAAPRRHLALRGGQEHAKGRPPETGGRPVQE